MSGSNTVQVQVKRPYVKKPKIKSQALLTQPNQVATYSSRKKYPQSFSLISPDSEQLVDQLLDPESSMDPMRWPNTYGLSAVYKAKNVINARFAADNRCAAIVYPTMLGAIYTTAGSTSVYSLPAFNEGVTSPSDPSALPHGSQFFTITGSDISYFNQPILFSSSDVLVPVYNSNQIAPLYPASFAALGNSVDLQFFGYLSGINPGLIILKARLYDINFVQLGGVSINGANGADPARDDGFMSTLFTSPATIGAAYFSLEIYHRDPATALTQGLVRIGIASSDPLDVNQIFMTLPNHAQHMTVYDIRDADTLVNNSEKFFISAQSLLITAEMSTTRDGGVLAIARVPADTAVGFQSGQAFDSWYEYISSLPYNSYDGPIKHGGYSWYLPDDERGYFYRKVDTVNILDLPFMVTEFTAADVTEGSIVRIKVATTVQFTTNASIYSLAPSAYMGDIEYIHHMLSCINAAYSNDGHADGLKRALKMMGSKIVQLLKDPHTYTTVAKIASTLGALAI